MRSKMLNEVCWKYVVECGRAGLISWLHRILQGCSSEADINAIDRLFFETTSRRFRESLFYPRSRFLMMTDREWSRKVGSDEYVISTSRALLSYSAIQSFFGHETMYWAKVVPIEHLQLMLDHCLTFGLYIKSASISTASSNEHAEPVALTQIGMARLISDMCTAAYLKDVFVLPEYQGLGLGSWMVSCCGEVVNDFPQPTRLMLFHTNMQTAGRWYKTLLGVEEFQQRANGNVFASMRTNPTQSEKFVMNSGSPP